MTKPAGQLGERVRLSPALAECPTSRSCRLPIPSLIPTLLPRQLLLLMKFPDLAGIACVDAGAELQLWQFGSRLAGKVKIISMDRGADVLQEIEAGFFRLCSTADCLDAVRNSDSVQPVQL